MEDLKELFKVTITEGILQATGDNVHIIRVEDVVRGKTNEKILPNLDRMNCDADDVIQFEVNSLIRELSNEPS